jgi:2,4-dienoyl-CoA reductase-like NADH-dependent reductase (Old Yellow Enzyme family)
MNLAGWTKKLTGKAVITVGSIGLATDFIEGFKGGDIATNHQHLQHLVRMVETGEVDLAAVGRALIADPEWSRKLREGRGTEVTAYSSDNLKTLV